MFPFLFNPDHFWHFHLATNKCNRDTLIFLVKHNPVHKQNAYPVCNEHIFLVLRDKEYFRYIFLKSLNKFEKD